MTIRDNFLPPEHSMMLKKLGFNDQCLYFYRSTQQYNAHNYNSEILLDDECSAALWMQAEIWLWEKHSIVIEIADISTGGEYGEHGIDEFESSVRVGGEYLDVIQKDSPISARMEVIKKAISDLYSQLELNP